jgi:hypothetical protein
VVPSGGAHKWTLLLCKREATTNIPSVLPSVRPSVRPSCLSLSQFRTKSSSAYRMRVIAKTPIPLVQLLTLTWTLSVCLHTLRSLLCPCWPLPACLHTLRPLVRPYRPMSACLHTLRSLLCPYPRVPTHCGPCCVPAGLCPRVSTHCGPCCVPAALCPRVCTHCAPCCVPADPLSCRGPWHRTANASALSHTSLHVTSLARERQGTSGHVTLGSTLCWDAGSPFQALHCVISLGFNK